MRENAGARLTRTTDVSREIQQAHARISFDGSIHSVLKIRNWFHGARLSCGKKTRSVRNDSPNDA